MKERPIILKPEEVRAILDGRKTQARRIVKPQSAILTDEMARALGVQPPKTQNPPVIPCPFGQPGDRLWVRETFAITPSHGQHRSDNKRWGLWDGLPQRISPDGTQVAYYREAFDRCDPPKWMPPVIMPRWASRILLEVTAVRVERLQDISESDAVAEGLIRYGEGFRYALDFPWFANPVAAFRSGWDKNNRPATWAGNWWVWVIEFRMVEP